MRHQRCTHGFTGAGQQLQGILGHAGFMQDVNHGGSGQRRLLGRLGNHGIAGSERCSDLAAENGQRKVPGTDGQHHAQRTMRAAVELRCRLGAVIAQKVHSLAHFGNGVVQCLAGFAHDQAQQALAALLQQIGSALQGIGALLRRRTRPDRRGQAGTRGGSSHLLGSGLLHPAHGIALVGRVAHGLPAFGLGQLFGHRRISRCSAMRFAGAVQQRRSQRGQLLLVGHIETTRVGPRLLALPGEQVHRQGNARVGSTNHTLFLGQRLHFLYRIGHQLRDRHTGIANAVDEGGVGAVFQQAAHQIGKQRLVAAHRRVDTARSSQLAVSHQTGHLLIQRLAHAVQALEFILAAVVVGTCHVVDRRQRLGIVRGELGIDRIRNCQQLARAGQIAHIGIDLARIDRIAVHAIHLGALDLAVPVGALHQTDHQATARPARQIDQVVDHMRAALLVGLHHKADAVPATQRGSSTQRFQQIQRQLQAVGFFGIDVHADVVALAQLGQHQHTWQQLAHHAVVLCAGVARMQGREFDGNARPFKNAAPGRCRANRMDGLLVVAQVAFGVRLGRGRFAQHVIAVAEALLLERTAVGQRFGNILSGDELLAHQLHGTVHALADQRLAALADHARQRRRQALLAGGAGQLAGNHQTPGRGVDEHGRRTAHMGAPVAVANLVADQSIARGTVRDAQQRFGQTHQGHTLLAGQRKLLHQRRNTARHRRITQALHQLAGQALHGLRLLGVIGTRHRQQHRQAFRLGTVPGGRDRCTQRRLRQDALGKLEERLHLFCHLSRFGLHLLFLRHCAGLRQMDHGLATLQCLDILHNGLLHQPVRSAFHALCRIADAITQRIVHLDSHGARHVSSFHSLT